MKPDSKHLPKYHSNMPVDTFSSLLSSLLTDNIRTQLSASSTLADSILASVISDPRYSQIKNRYMALERENRNLRVALNNAGISFSPLSDTFAAEEKYPDQSILPIPITREFSRRFFSYFWGRTDVFSKRTYSKKAGKSRYYPQCDNFWKNGLCPRVSGEKTKCKDCTNQLWTKLSPSHIEAHLRGNKEDASDVIGVYPLFPDNTCRFLVFDFDNHDTDSIDTTNTKNDWKNEIDALREICQINHIPALVERSRSGQGAHLWIFFDSPVDAALARRFGFALLERGAESVNLKSFRYYDRMLPAQDYLPDGGLGNLIALPLQGQALKKNNSAFVDSAWIAFPNQVKALFSTKKLSKSEIESFITTWNNEQQDSNRFSALPLNDDTKPWERHSTFHREDVNGSIHLVLANKLYIESQNLRPRLQNQIRRLAAMSNPKFYKNQAMGLSNFADSRFLYLGRDDGGYICIPRGLQDALLKKCEEADIPILITDQRSAGKNFSVSFEGELRENQKLAVEKLLAYDYGILSAATAFGKTVVCSNIISRKKVSTLILLESTALIEQWEKALNRFLVIAEELPQYQTKTGRVKKRLSHIGIIHGAKDTSNGIIDIAMAGSLFKNGEPHTRLKDYGLILVDECHHSAADTIRTVLEEVNAKYVYGVTATPFRGDGLEKINEMLLGPVRFEFTAKEKAIEQGIPHLVIPRFTRAVYPHGTEKQHINDVYELIRDSEIRNQQIIEDVQKCIDEGRTPVVLTRYKEHAAMIYEGVKNCADSCFLLTGDISKKDQRKVRTEMDAVADSQTMILVATGQLIGEGFDFPRLDTLIMATPVAWKGIVEQYAGRLNRDYPGKKSVIIYDYVDSHIPVLDNMYAKRLKAYKQMGYQVYSGASAEKQTANAIYDSDSYLTVYEQDLVEAQNDIVISSPTLGRNKVYRFIRLVKDCLERGIQVTIVTWHLDAYRYGRDETRIELMELLRNTGFHLVLAEEHCEHYAVIDRKIVWYGSMRLLSRDDVDDNIMRVVSADIATELLGMTFGLENKPVEYSLPI